MNNTVSEQIVKFWFQEFASSDFILENQKRVQLQWPLINDENLKVVVKSDPKSSVKELRINFN